MIARAPHRPSVFRFALAITCVTGSGCHAGLAPGGAPAAENDDETQACGSCSPALRSPDAPAHNTDLPERNVLALHRYVGANPHGEDVACFLPDDGVPLCMGASSPLLGVGTDPPPATTPQPVAKLTDVTSIEMAYSATLAIRSDGSLWYWGGFPGGGCAPHNPLAAVPTKIAGGGRLRFRSVAGGPGIAAVTEAGTVLHSTAGLYGSGCNTQLHAVPGLHGVVQGASGLARTCALKANGTVWCWGGGDFSSLGNGVIGGSTTPVQVSGIDDAVSVVASDNTMCALRVDGRVACWGSNAAGELGNGDLSLTSATTPVSVLGVEDAVSLAANYGVGGPTTFCAVDVGGRLTCWGHLYGGAVPQPVVGVEGATQLAISFRSSDPDPPFTPWAPSLWVLRDDGQVVRNEPPDLTTFNAVDGFDAGLARPRVVAGDAYTCGLRPEGTVACWGENSSGQLGNGSTDSTAAPTETELDAVVELAAGAEHACAIRRDRSLWCWGEGFGSTPNQVPQLENVVAMAPGTESTCALVEDGHVWCWGENDFGQLGDGTYTPHANPAVVPDLQDVTLLSTAGIHTCAVEAGGMAWCWGMGLHGELGDGSTGASAVPVRVRQPSFPWLPLTEVVGVATGASTTCAVVANGTAHCWGADAHGLGNGTIGLEQLYPEPVTGVIGARDVALGSGAQCVRLSSGQVRCFGTNFVGELGNPDVALGVDQPYATTVGGSSPLEGVIALGSGSAHSCALLTDGAMRCWGDGSSGQLGDGTNTDSAAPVPVLGW